MSNSSIYINNLLIETGAYSYDELNDFITELGKSLVKDKGAMAAVELENFRKCVLRLKSLEEAVKKTSSEFKYTVKAIYDDEPSELLAGFNDRREAESYIDSKETIALEAHSHAAYIIAEDY